uniref:snRNA-activating protein complex subunit 4 n=1 Tax=Sus scrofa TaxID=9823 RepID=A0A8D1K981_PIG
MDVDAEREKISKEIKELERILDPGSSGINDDVSESSLDSDSEAESLPDDDADATGPLLSEDERWGDASNDEDDAKERALPEDPETCLQLNMVYQEVVREKLAEVSLLLAQNCEQQEEVSWALAGSGGRRVKDGRSPPARLYVGHFMKPYFKDKVTGAGPPANEDTREKAAQGVKAFEELLVTKWKSWEKALLRKAVVSDRLQRLLQPKLLKLEYLQQKQSRATSDAERQALEKQVREAEKEVQDISQLPEEALLGHRLDSHDWEKIANVNFEGGRSAEETRKFWQNHEHPSINKQEWSAQEVDRLKAIAAKHGHLRWQEIAEELGTRRSAFQCLQKYQQHNAALKRREWTQEEDRMLTQLVQAMGVGSHIPYRRIAYYMEGRDSTQLIYRWTKSLDPALKKGLWAPEEDAKLLQAVAKYGEQDWFKIREEVPGRSDAQCRDRYLRRLRLSLKKGRWSAQEEERLLELIGKHGVGHWAKIASELPHRTDSQCLSKWKIMARKQQSRGRRRRRPLRRVCWSSSSEDSGDSGDSGGSSSSSSSSEDVEPEGAPEARADGPAPPSAQHPVPDMDLWVPTRQSARVPWGVGPGAWPGHRSASPRPPEGSDTAPGEEVGRAQAPSETPSASLRGGGCPRSADARPSGSEGLADEGPRRPLTVPLETVLRVLRTNTAALCRVLKEKLRRPRLLGSPLGPSPSDSSVARPRVQPRWRRRHALQRRLLERQLLMAVSPWVGDVTLPCAPWRPAVLHRRADGIGKQLQGARLASTPVFTLLIQLFRIDTAGCMEVVRERRAQPPALPSGGRVPSSARNSPGHLFQNGSARGAAKKSASHSGGGGPQSAPAPSGPRPKPKTVSELLREKRLREARARKAAQGPAVLPPQGLLSSPAILQPLPPQQLPVSGAVLSGPGGPAVASPSAPGPWASAKEGPPSLHALALAPASMAAGVTPAAPRAPALGPSQVPASCHLSSLGQSQAPATSRKQGLPEAPPFLPAAPSPIQLPVQPRSLTPALAAHTGASHVVASTPLPVTWVLTAQGLLPVPAVVGLPRPAGPPDPEGLSGTPPPSLTETRAGRGPKQPPAHVSVGPDPPAKTPPTAQSPAEGDGDVAHGPGGPSCPGEAQVAGEASVPRTLSPAKPLADHPEAEPCGSSQLPLPGGLSPGGAPTRHQGLERPPPPWPGPEKGAPDLRLLSQESEAAVRGWLTGQRGVCVPPLASRLPYQPPTLCSLRALSGLLLHKKALEHRAASLVPSGTAGAQQAPLGQVRERLQSSPAYLLLKARFLAAFALPALLATLPPHGVPTTLSAAAGVDSESDDDSLDELELADDGGPLGGWPSGRQAGPAAPTPTQGAPGEGSAPPGLDSDDLDILRTRHAWHARKRRRLV